MDQIGKLNIEERVNIINDLIELPLNQVVSLAILVEKIVELIYLSSVLTRTVLDNLIQIFHPKVHLKFSKLFDGTRVKIETVLKIGTSIKGGNDR